MGSNLTKKYAVGPVAKMRELFPTYSRGDERYSLDGTQVIYELDLTDEEITAISNARRSLVKLYGNEEAVAMLNAPASAGVWYEQVTGEGTGTTNEP